MAYTIIPFNAGDGTGGNLASDQFAQGLNTVTIVFGGLAFGTLGGGAAYQTVDATHGLPVEVVAALPSGTNVIGHVIVDSGTISLPAGASTSALQTTGNTSLASIDTKITACNTGAVTVSSSVLPTGAATSANQSTIISALATLVSDITVCNTDAIAFASPQPVTQSGVWSVTADTELTTDDLDTGAGTDTRAVVGLVYAASGGGVLVSAANPLPVTGTFSSGASTGTLTNRSGTITTGGTAQTLAASNSSRKYLLIENLDAANSLWINFTTTAVESQPSIEIQPGGSFVMDAGFVSTEAISVIGPSTGQAFAAKEG